MELFCGTRRGILVLKLSTIFKESMFNKFSHFHRFPIPKKTPTGKLQIHSQTGTFPAKFRKHLPPPGLGKLIKSTWFQLASGEERRSATEKLTFLERSDPEQKQTKKFTFFRTTISGFFWCTLVEEKSPDGIHFRCLLFLSSFFDRWYWSVLLLNAMWNSGQQPLVGGAQYWAILNELEKYEEGNTWKFCRRILARGKWNY